MADFENIVVEGTAEQLRNVLDGSAYTDQKMNQYGIQKAGYLSLQSKESDSDDDIIDISPALSVKAEDGYPEYGILEIHTSRERSETVLRGIHDAVNPDDATPLKQVKALLESEGNSNKKSVLYIEQNLTDKEKAQARQNIGAMKQPAESDSLNFNSSELKNVSSIELVHRNKDGAQTGGVFVSSAGNKIDENGGRFSNLSLDPSDAGSVVVSGLHDGILDTDAATVGQIKKVAPYLLVAEETEDGKGVLVVGNWDTMVLELKKGRSIILASTSILSSEPDVSVSIYHLAVAYQEDGYAVFFHTDEQGHSIVIVRYDGSVEFKYVDLLKLDPTLSLYGDYAAPASVVGKKLGNIETTLATVKPYVVKLVYAYDEGSGEMIPSIADSFGFNWDDMVAAVKSNRPVMCYLSGVEGSDDVVDASAFELTYIEYANEFAIFSSLAEVGAEYITILSDGACSRKFIDFVTSDDIGKGIVKTVNGIAPDGNGNVEIETGGDTETAFDFDETYVITEEEIVNGTYARTTDSQGDPISLSEMQVDFTTPAGSNTGICYLYFRYTSNGTPTNMRVSEFPYQHAEKVRRARTICYKVRDSFYKIEGYMWNEDDSYTALQHTNGARMNCGVFFDNPTPLNGFHFTVANGSPVAGTEIRVRGRKA